MKKIISLILAVSMLLSLSVTALAANDAPAVTGGNKITGNDGQKPSTIGVSGIYDAGAEAADKISVNITWEEMTFTYSMGVWSDWDPSSHSYTNRTGEGWLEESRTITVTNHSNAGITAAFTFTEADNVAVNGSFTQDSITLATAEGTEPESAPAGSTAFSISGDGIAVDSELGTISVSIAKAADDAGDDMPSEPDNDITDGNSLQIAFEGEGSTVVLNQNIDMGADCLIMPDGAYLDLNGYTLSGSGYMVVGAYTDGNVSISNGTIVNTGGGDVIQTGGGNFTLTNCGLIVDGFTTESKANAFLGEYLGTSTLTNCTLDGNVLVTAGGETQKAIAEFSGETNINGAIYEGEVTDTNPVGGGEVYCKAGTYNFNPTKYLYNRTSYQAINQGNSTWEVVEL